MAGVGRERSYPRSVQPPLTQAFEPQTARSQTKEVPGQLDPSLLRPRPIRCQEGYGVRRNRGGRGAEVGRSGKGGELPPFGSAIPYSGLRAPDRKVPDREGPRSARPQPVEAQAVEAPQQRTKNNRPRRSQANWPQPGWAHAEMAPRKKNSRPRRSQANWPQRRDGATQLPP